jgi:hypothetical protein
MKRVVPIAAAVLALAGFVAFQNVRTEAQLTAAQPTAQSISTLPPAVAPATPIPTITPLSVTPIGGTTASPLPGMTTTPLPGTVPPMGG